jgi:hypothetical protein
MHPNNYHYLFFCYANLLSLSPGKTRKKGDKNMNTDTNHKKKKPIQPIEKNRTRLNLAKSHVDVIAIFESISPSGICLYRLVALEKPLNEYYVIACPFCGALLVPLKEAGEEKAVCLECGVVI